MRNRGSVVLAVLFLIAAVAAGCAQQGGSNSGSNRRSQNATSSQTGTGSANATSGAGMTGRRNTARLYTAKLAALNNSGVTGDATVTVKANSITVTVKARGLTPDQMHPQHLHGFRDNKPSSMPPTDTDLTDQTAEQFAGPPMLALEPFPKASGNGDVDFTNTFDNVAMFYPLDIRSIELHGMMRNGQYDFTLPVAAGPLKPVAGGASGSSSSSTTTNPMGSDQRGSGENTSSLGTSETQESPEESGQP